MRIDYFKSLNDLTYFKDLKCGEIIIDTKNNDFWLKISRYEDEYVLNLKSGYTYIPSKNEIFYKPVSHELNKFKDNFTECFNNKKEISASFMYNINHLAGSIIEYCGLPYIIDNACHCYNIYTGKYKHIGPSELVILQKDAFLSIIE